MSTNRDYNVKLLEMAGFEGDELEAFLPDWMAATEIVGLTDEDVKNAYEDYIPKHWDIQYKGIRMMIGAFFHEMVDATKTKQYKAEGKNVIYGLIPSVPFAYYAMREVDPDAYIAFPDLILVDTINSFFHNAGPFLNYAEELGFTYGCRHCPLNKMRMSAFAKGILAAPTVIWSWGFNCDEASKTDEMIQCLLDENWNSLVCRAPHDTNFGEKDDSDERIRYVAKVMKDDLDKIAEFTGIQLTKEAIDKANEKIMRYSFKYGQLIAMVSKADPPPVRGSSITQFAVPQAVGLNNGFKYFEPAIDVLMKELRAAIKKGEGIVPKGAPKVGSYFVPFCIPWVDRIFLENGVATTFSLTMTPSKSQMSPTDYPNDIYLNLAEAWLRFPLGQNMGYEVESMVEKVEAYKPDGMLMGFFDFDRWLGAHQKMCADLVEKRTGVPHYYMESDFWDDRDYSEEALRTRIESISQMLYMKKEME